MVLTDDPQLDAQLRILRDHGMNPQRRYWHDVVGYNYRMTNLQAAIGCAQLERWDQIIAAKERIRRWYDANLPRGVFQSACPPPHSKSVCWLYSILLKDGKCSLSRDELMGELRKTGIDSRPLFSPIPAMPPYFNAEWEQRFPNASSISRTGFSLPSSVEMDNRSLRRITENIARLLQHNCSTNN